MTGIYIEDITDGVKIWIFRVAKQYFTHSLRSFVKYCFCHKKIKFVLSSTRCVMFFLLYRQKVIVTAQIYSTAYKTLFTIIWRNNTELNRALHWQNISKATEIQRTQDVYKFWREITEITSSINSRVRLWKINHSGPGCSFYEFYEWYIFL